jgi:hypothetical protein
VERSPAGPGAVRPLRRAENPAWRGVVVFVLRERAAERLESAVAGIARGLEIIEVVPLDAGQRAAARSRIRGGQWGRDGRPVDGGGPHTFIIACDVTPPEVVLGARTAQTRTTETRAAEVRARTTQRLLRGVEDGDVYEPLHHSDGAAQAMDYLEILDDPAVRSRLLVRLGELSEACAPPFPLVRMLAPESPGFRARVALVDHPVHGRCVCKIFRPGAERYFRRELAARIALADLPEVPALLEHGPNWLLTPVYADDATHIRRRLPNVAGVSQLRPDASRALARFGRALHERGMFILDLSPHNLMTDPDAGLTVLDLEFVQAYAGPTPPLRDCYTFRGVPRELRSPDDDVPDLVLTKGVGNSVFHPAVAGARVGTLLRPARRGDALRMAAVQLGWFAAFGLLTPLYAALARRRGQ